MKKIDEFEIYSPTYNKIDVQTFIDNGKRGWDGVYYGNASDKFSIYPLKDGSNILQKIEDIVNNGGLRNTVKSEENGLKGLWKRLWK